MMRAIETVNCITTKALRGMAARRPTRNQNVVLDRSSSKQVLPPSLVRFGFSPCLRAKLRADEGHGALFMNRI